MSVPLRVVRLPATFYMPRTAPGGEVKDVIPWQGATDYVTDGARFGIMFADESVEWIADIPPREGREREAFRGVGLRVLARGVLEYADRRGIPESGWHERLTDLEAELRDAERTVRPAPAPPSEKEAPSARALPERRLVEPEALLALLNERLDAYGQCYGCQFAGPIRRLSEPAEDGRNWSRFLALSCSNRLVGGCARLAQRIVDDAGTEYNLI